MTITYNLYYSTTPGVTIGNGTQIANVTSPHILSSLAYNTEYYFIATEINATGEGPASTQEANLTLPDMPTGVSVVAGTAENTLTWTTIGGLTYNIYWSLFSNVSPSLGTKISNVITPTIQSGLSAGITYYYVVTAVNTTGEGLPCAPVNATIPVPGTLYTLVSAFRDQGGGYYSYGYDNFGPFFGSLTPVTLPGGATMEMLMSQLGISGFTTTFVVLGVQPQNLFASITANSITVLSANATYTVTGGTYTTWNWPGVNIFTDAITYTVDIV